MSRLKERTFTTNVITLFLEGCFCETYGNDALVLGGIFGYRVKEMRGGTPTCGFPQKHLKECLIVLDGKHISYIVLAGSEVKRQRDFGEENAYSQYGKNIQVEPYNAAKQPASESTTCGPADYVLPDLMPLFAEHGRALRLYVMASEIEVSFVDGYILHLN